MANNKDFLLKNAVEVGGSTKVTLGSIAAGSTVGYALSDSSYDSVSFSVASQEASPTGLAFNSDGTKIYVSGFSSDAIHQYSLSTAYDISTASYDSVSFSFASQSATSFGMAFNDDGTKMYVLDYTFAALYQYSLSTAFDISTTSYDSVNFSVASQTVDPVGMAFNDDGTKMYVCEDVAGILYQYSLSTAFDLSTASYASVSFDISDQDIFPRGLTFNDDGTKMYLVGNSNDSIYQYSLSTAFDLSTASYDSVSFSVASQDTGPTGIAFNSNGTKVYLIGVITDTIYQYSTSVTPQEVNLATGNYFADTLAANTTYTLSNAGDVQSFQLEVTGGFGSQYDLANAVYDGVSFSVASEETAPTSLFFKPDGTKMYVLGQAADDINEYDLSTAWDVSTASYLQVFSVAAQDTAPTSLFFKPDGTKMYVLGETGDDVNEYDLSTAWDISTASYLQRESISAQETDPSGLFFKSDGTKMYVSGKAGDDVNEYNLSTAWDVSTSSFVQSFSFAAKETNPNNIFFSADGTNLYILGLIGDDITEYSLSTAWDVSTASYVQEFSVAAQEANAYGLFFKPDGTKMYIVGVTNDTIYQYSTAVATTITWPSSIEWNGGTAPETPAIGETDVFTFITDDGGTSYVGLKTADNIS